MVLKFHVQHYQTVGPQSDKILLGQESKMAIVTKNRKLIKSIFSPEPLSIVSPAKQKRDICIAFPSLSVVAA